MFSSNASLRSLYDLNDDGASVASCAKLVGELDAFDYNTFYFSDYSKNRFARHFSGLVTHIDSHCIKALRWAITMHWQSSRIALLHHYLQ
jgi:hypothetical protein